MTKRRTGTSLMFIIFTLLSCLFIPDIGGFAEVPIQIEETQLLKIHLQMKPVYAGMQVGNILKPLPIGSSLEKEQGIFSWLPGPGFVGTYRFCFMSSTGTLKSYTIRINPASKTPLPTSCLSSSLAVPRQDGLPFGIFATPLAGSTVSSSIAVTGWALDEKAVVCVKIYRQSGTALVYIGDAVFIEGARPDVEAAYPGYPNNSAAGWGYMLLTHFLPNGGNGTYTLVAQVSDSDGHIVTLGSKTITVDNSNAIKPFGAIDTPSQGGTASGSSLRNQGWILTPQPNKVPEDGSTIHVYIDGILKGNATYNIFRSDIATLFPGYANSSGALAYFDLDTTVYTNGVHTIAWRVVDSAGNIDGIGSRFFTVANNPPKSGDFYISVTGDDSNDGTSRNTAFRTISKAFQVVQPGQTILVLNGTYSESIQLDGIGSDAGIITLTGESTAVILDGLQKIALGIWCENCTNIVFDTLDIRNYSDIGIGALNSSHITMRNLIVRDNGFASQLDGWEIEGYGIDIDDCSHVLIEFNDVSGNGPNPQVPGNLMGTGINTFSCTDCIIRNNLSYNNIGGGMLVEDGINVLVEGNTVYDNDADASVEQWWDAGLWVDGGRDITVRNNSFTGNLGAGIEVSDEDLQGPTGYIIKNNISTGNYFGIYIWNFGTTGWPADAIINRSGNTINNNTQKDIWILPWTRRHRNVVNLL